MKRILMLVVAALALAAGSNPACAGGGTIRFSGAVVEPTCSVVATDAAPVTGAGTAKAGQDHMFCGRTSADSGRGYTRNVLELNARAVATNRLLSYYAGYADGAGDGRVKLVVRTYD
ncbi:MAG: hypothetical protein AB1832_06490 [Pseudomonadota bacterium]